MRGILAAALFVTAAFGAAPAAEAATLFSDDFESGLDGWTPGGTVASATTRAHGGVHSLESTPAANADGIGYLDRGVPSVNAGLLSVWFYDDGEGCGGGEAKTQAVLIHERATYPSSTRGVGVWSHTSACYYVFRQHWTLSPTTVPRSVGWHEFRFTWDGAGMRVTIDGVSVHHGSYTGDVDRVTIGDAWWSTDTWAGHATGPAWFDDVLLTDADGPSLVVRSLAVDLPAIPEGAPGHASLGGISLPDAGVAFDVDMADLAHKREMASAPPYRLDVDALVQAAAPPEWEPPRETVVAHVYWNGDGPLPVVAHEFVPTPSGWSFRLRAVAVPASAVMEDVNRVAVVPHREAGQPAWDVALNTIVMELAAAPVVIVHGWNPDKDAGRDGDPWPVPGWQEALRRGLQREAVTQFGRNPWTWLGGDDAFRIYGYDGKQDFRKSVAVLEAQMSDHAAELSYGGKVDIVSHSMGGLVSRYYVERLGGDVHVGKLVTMGTPHLGSGWADKNAYRANALHEDPFDYYRTRDGDSLWQPRGLLGIRGSWKNWWQQDIGAFRDYDRHDLLADFELFPRAKNPILQDLSSTFGSGSVPYHTIAGVRTAYKPLAVASDDIVSGWSATHGYDSRACWRVLDFPAHAWPLVHGLLPEDERVHASATTFLALGSTEAICDGGPPAGAERADGEGERPTEIRLLVPREPCIACPRPASSSAAEGAAFVTANVSLLNAEVAEFHFTIPEGSAAEAVFALWTPSREYVTPDTVSTVNGTFVETLGLGLRVARFAVPAPEDGTWVLEARATNATPENGTMVFFETFYDSPVLLALESAPAVVDVNESSPIVVGLRRDAVGVANATVRVEVTNPETGLARTVRLFDDGRNGDGEAGDGVYGGAYSGGTPGTHEAVVRATGSAEGVAFEETLVTAFTFNAPVERPAPCASGLPAVPGEDPEGVLSEYASCVLESMEVPVLP